MFDDYISDVLNRAKYKFDVYEFLVVSAVLLVWLLYFVVLVSARGGKDSMVGLSLAVQKAALQKQIREIESSQSESVS